MRPQRSGRSGCGLLFLSVPVMKLVEVVRTICDGPAVYEEVVAFGAKLGKNGVCVRTTRRDSS